MHLALPQPTLWMAFPFAILLLAIALCPLLVPAWWGKHYPKVALGLGLVTLTYYLGWLHATEAVMHTAAEYVSFIALIGSLYVVSGGIHISIKGEATPWANVVFLAIGAVVANFLGTTGASMLMIRPWLRMNKYRITGHHVVFFIFIVSNVGGCLTPIGDPPLFLGYLKGVPFWWVVRHCWPMWVVGVAFLLGLFLVLDYRNYLRAPKQVRAALAEPADQWRFDGLSNVVFLGVILAAVFVRPILREALMFGAAAASYLSTQRAVHAANHFTFHPIQEVAILFIGIFATMMPALDWLRLHAADLGNPSTALIFWSSGVLSSMLDNAPTYLSFFQALSGALVSAETVAQVQQIVQHGPGLEAAPGSDQVQAALAILKTYFPSQLAAGSLDREHIETAVLLGSSSRYLVALSVGAVFFGANTYIGNGPNLMVKSIADHQKVHTPSFLGYVFAYTVPIMGPMLLLVWWIFFR
jgi:Na+/H+ antiporter NhaD/arsenite permease-like protein